MWTTAAPLEDAAGYWNTLFAQWIWPAGQLVGPLVITFFALCAVASIATRLVPVSVPTEPRLPARTAVAGLVLIAAASAAPALVMPLRSKEVSWASWSSVAVVAALGVGLLAYGMATRLRIRVDVRDAAGQPDVSAADYVLARLERLGADRPRGLQRPQHTDVMGLPDNALDTLPENKVLSALLKLVYAIVPLMPWRATVAWLDADRLSVTLWRNGRLVNATVVSRPALGLPAAQQGDQQAADSLRARLLTGVAAFVLLEVADKASVLRRGLCGASRWDALALQVLANDPKTQSEPDSDLRLLARAVDRDPGNHMAKYAFLVLRCRYSPDPGEQRSFAKAMSALVCRVSPQRAAEERAVLLETCALVDEQEATTLDKPSLPAEEGFEALEMRALHAEGAAWLNAHLLQPDPSALRSAARAARALLERCDRYASGQIKGFVKEIGPTAGFLWQCVVGANRTLGEEKFDRQAQRWSEAQDMSLYAHYDRACARLVAEEPDLDGALEDLHLACAAPELQEWASQDPSLENLRKRGEFWAAIGRPRATAFTDLEPIKPHVPKLVAAGIHTAGQLRRHTASRHDKVELSVYLHVTVQEVTRLHRVAALVSRSDYLAARPWLVDLLISSGVDSRRELRRRLGDANELREALQKLADDRGIDEKLPELEDMRELA
jgi:hypothetical protein